eukprot:15450266-Alexandrium_andersonii.AAC.1
MVLERMLAQRGWVLQQWPRLRSDQTGWTPDYSRSSTGDDETSDGAAQAPDQPPDPPPGHSKVRAPHKSMPGAPA